MKHASVTLPQDCWDYLDKEALRLKCSRSFAAAHVIRECRDNQLVKRLERIEQLLNIPPAAVSEQP
jgi:hypothetical protein